MITERPKDFEHWRRIARELLERQASPREVRWLAAEDPQGDLFAAPGLLAAEGLVEPAAGGHDESAAGSSAPAPSTCLPRLSKPRCKNPRLIVPREFVELASLVACHRDPARWDLLYRALWMITHGEPRLLRLDDETASRLLTMENAVRRDIRRMKTAVRFRGITVDGQERHLAWHRPEHRVLNLVAPFFKRRFRTLNWTLLTPDGCVSWDGATLRRGPGVVFGAASPTGDELAEMWRGALAPCLA